MAISNDSKIALLKTRNRLIGLFPILSDCESYWHVFKAVRNWRSRGWTVPPPYEIKRAMLRAEAHRLGATHFVETGTYMGDTPWALRKDFKRLFSIEVQPQLAAIASKRFKRLPQVTIVSGDSGAELTTVVKQVAGPCVFWLDGHYSAGLTGRGRNDCPIVDEFEAIYRNAAHPYSIFVDDARCFGVDPSYPSVGDLKALLATNMPDFELQIQNDVIQIQKRGALQSV